MAAWYIENGPESDVVISSRIRLARNFCDYPFPHRMTNEQEEKVLEETRNAVSGSKNSSMQGVRFIDINSLNGIDRQLLVEKHLISSDLAQGKRQSGVLLSEDEKISIMVNEEDHLRIQCLFPGMQMDNAWKLCNSIDNILEKKINYAVSNELGYLTCCPTNVGTGIRASVMLHLPALVMTGYISGVLEACGKLGVAIRGLYGENSEAAGNMFQLSNQVTLGQTEEEIITNITDIANQVIEQERMLRTELYNQNPYRFEDKVMRSYGLLTNARILSSEESLKLLSDVRLGINMGIIKEVETEVLNEIMIMTQPASLQIFVGRPLSPDERDIKRAELIIKKLKH